MFTASPANIPDNPVIVTVQIWFVKSIETDAAHHFTVRTDNTPMCLPATQPNRRSVRILRILQRGHVF
jgi:hypothetical protein